MKKALFTVLAASLLAGAPMTQAFAATFDSSTGGPAVAVVNAGGGGDYLTLGEAATAFSGVVGGINRPWTIEIASNTTEATNVYFANTFGVDGSLTIKPAAATTPVVDFTFTGTVTGIFGHLVIGTTDGTLPDTPNYRESNGKYTIDGSNTVGGTTRDLTFKVGSSGTPLATSMNRLIRVFGNNHGVVIKNMKLHMYDTSGTASAVALAGGQVPSGGTSVAPDGIQILNNEIISSSSTNNAFGIDSTMAANGTAAAGTSFDNSLIADNDITAQQRGIFMNGFANTTVARNNVSLVSTLGNVTFGGIFHLNSNTVSPFTINIDRNTVDVAITAATWTAAQGPIGIFLDSGSVGAVGNFNVTNNTVKLSAQGGSATDILFRGISASSVTSNYVIEHNSVELAAGSASGVTASRAAAVSAVLTFTTGSAAIRNNILVNRDLDGATSPLYTAAVTNVTSANNNLVGRVAGRVGTTDYADIATWNSTSTIDTTSQSVDPATTSPAWGADLLFASAPGTIATVAASTTLTDINGNTRPATGAFPGAQQPSSSVADWMLH